MNFDIKIWNEWRHQASILAEHILSYKDDKGILHIDKEQLQGYIAHITCILKECDNYMDKCNLTSMPGLWKYDAKDVTTHPSSIAFLYKDRMTKQQIRNYGEGFMSEPIPEPKEPKKAA